MLWRPFASGRLWVAVGGRRALHGRLGRRRRSRSGRRLCRGRLGSCQSIPCRHQGLDICIRPSLIRVSTEQSATESLHKVRLGAGTRDMARASQAVFPHHGH